MLMMAYAERKAALEAYRDYDQDYVLLDGRFFYFKGMCRYPRSVELDLEEMSTGLDLVRKVRNTTLELINTSKAVCVIRRSVIRAIVAGSSTITARAPALRRGTSTY